MDIGDVVRELLVEPITEVGGTADAAWTDSEFTVNTVPDLIAPILAHRAWRVAHKPHDGWLRSIYANGLSGDWAVWRPGEPHRALCRHHDAPHSACGCGVYAAKSLPDVAGLDEGWVIGEVSLWGRVVEHEHGYRAQWAQPRRLAVVVPNATVWEIRVLRGGYGVAARVAAAYPTLPVACVEERSGFEITREDVLWLEEQEAYAEAAAKARVVRLLWEQRHWGVRLALRVSGVRRAPDSWAGPSPDERPLLAARPRDPSAVRWFGVTGNLPARSPARGHVRD